ncbi:26S proteasome regulatory subunit rpn2, putative, partial [Ixodes scapularis]
PLFAAGIISLLDENQTELKVFALKKLDNIVNEFWAEISEAIEKIPRLQVYYHLGSFEDSLTYALGASELFDVTVPSEYVETIIAKCIDHYTKLRRQEGAAVDARLEAIVDRMFQRCFEDGQFRQAVGIALETRRMDMFQKAIVAAEDVGAMLAYSSKVAMTLVQNRAFQDEVLRALVKLYRELDTPDYVNMCQCLIFLDDAQSVADVLLRLLEGSGSTLMAYQIAFDLYESATQQFLARVLQALRALAPSTNGDGARNTSGIRSEGAEEKSETSSSAAPVKMETADAAPAVPAQLSKLATILSGEVTIGLHLQFLIRSNHTDLLVLKQTKDAVRNSVCHTATVIANSLMHCGTTSDQFLRDNLEWLARATNWAKFTATASLGVIHKRRRTPFCSEANRSRQLLGKKDASFERRKKPSGWADISRGNGLRVVNALLLSRLKRSWKRFIVRHGGCLGVGLAAMSTHRQDVYEQLKFTLYQDDAVAGEAAGIAMGLVMLGSKESVPQSRIPLFYSTSLSSRVMLKKLPSAVPAVPKRPLCILSMIEGTLCVQDPLLRRSAMHALAMAYCGSGNNRAVRRLLHVAVSDVNDDVRRAAVEALGFILFRTPEQCPGVVSLLSESYNPNVRYGSAMALGISCAGTGNKEALSLLEPMTNDPVNYVRQGALVVLAVGHQMFRVWLRARQQHAALESCVVSDKHDDVMAKLGAILAQGILDAGGRNVTVALLSRTGHVNMAAVVGMLVFTQFWYWFPLAHFLSLALSPSCLVCLTGELRMPRLWVRSGAKPSTFAYPAPLEEKKEKEREKVTTAVLSITAKARRKEGRDLSSPEGMDLAESKPESKPEAKPRPEPNFELLSNPARVVKPQLKLLQMPEGSRYRPIKDITIGGIIMLADTKAEEAEELVEPVSAGGPTSENDEGDEPEPPEPFEYQDE